MSLIRAEARAALWRWREVLVGCACCLFGIWAFTQPGPVVNGIGAAAGLAGLGLVLIALRRLQFRGDEEAPGIVTIDEAQITYFGPVSGGSVSRAALREIRLRTQDGNHSWFLVTTSGEALTIPHGARGAEQLFDAFAALPGLDTPELLAKLTQKTDASVTVWRRPGERVLTSLASRDTS